MTDEMIDINLEDVEAWGEPIPTSLSPIHVTVDATDVKTASGSSFPYIEAQLKPKGVEDKYANRKLYLNLSFNPKALGHMRAFFEKAKIPLNSTKGKRPSEIARMIVGAELRVSFDIEEYNGTPRNKVKMPYYTV